MLPSDDKVFLAWEVKMKSQTQSNERTNLGEATNIDRALANRRVTVNLFDNYFFSLFLPNPKRVKNGGHIYISGSGFEEHKDLVKLLSDEGVVFLRRNFARTGLPSECADVVYLKNIINRADDFMGPDYIWEETFRIAKPGGSIYVCENKRPDGICWAIEEAKRNSLDYHLIAVVQSKYKEFNKEIGQNDKTINMDSPANKLRKVFVKFGLAPQSDKQTEEEWEILRDVSFGSAILRVSKQKSRGKN